MVVKYCKQILKINANCNIFIEEKDMKKLGKKLKQIEKLEVLTRELNEDEKAKIISKDSLLQKMKELSLS